MGHKSLPKPIIITRPQALSKMANRLVNEPILAVDTESNSLYAYKERVCLISFQPRKRISWSTHWR